MASIFKIISTSTVNHRTSSRDTTLKDTMLKMPLSSSYCNLLMMSSSSLDEEVTLNTVLDLGRIGERLKVKEIRLFRRVRPIAGRSHWGWKSQSKYLLKQMI